MSYPIPLATPTGSVRAWLCGNCEQVYTDQTSANACCICEICSTPRRMKNTGPHPACQVQQRSDKDRAEREAYYNQKRPSDRQVVHGYKGPVYCSLFPQHNEGFFASAEELRAWCAERGSKGPRRAYVCTVSAITFDVALLREEATEDLNDTATDNICSADWDGLQKLVDQWTVEQQISPRWDASTTKMCQVR